MSHQVNLLLALLVSHRQDSTSETVVSEGALMPIAVIAFSFDLAKFAIISIAPKTVLPATFTK